MRTQIINRLNEEKHNYQGVLMKIIKYNNANDIIVEFKDKYNAKVHATYNNFLSGSVKNPYYPSVCGVGVIGIKYPSRKNGKHLKEYQTWCDMLERCFDEKRKKIQYTYKDVICCDEWLNYENFYEWLHKQENFDKWLNGEHWCLDKDILIKNNKVYSPETCCLVPNNVNVLFTKRNINRGILPIGVTRYKNKYKAECSSPFEKYNKYLGVYLTSEEAFDSYKEYKEDLIKQIAQEEFNKGNITKTCYDVMMSYIVEIND
jgi:hypothetical protein